jgi:hypothetical protein
MGVSIPFRELRAVDKRQVSPVFVNRNVKSRVENTLPRLKIRLTVNQTCQPPKTKISMISTGAVDKTLHRLDMPTPFWPTVNQIDPTHRDPERSRTQQRSSPAAETDHRHNENAAQLSPTISTQFQRTTADAGEPRQIAIER